MLLKSQLSLDPIKYSLHMIQQLRIKWGAMIGNLGIVLQKEFADSDTTAINIKKLGVDIDPSNMPAIITPPGLPLDRQTYLYGQIRVFVSLNMQISCPRPMPSMSETVETSTLLVNSAVTVNNQDILRLSVGGLLVRKRLINTIINKMFIMVENYNKTETTKMFD